MIKRGRNANNIVFFSLRKCAKNNKTQKTSDMRGKVIKTTWFKLFETKDVSIRTSQKINKNIVEFNTVFISLCWLKPFLCTTYFDIFSEIIYKKDTNIYTLRNIGEGNLIWLHSTENFGLSLKYLNDASNYIII